MLLRLETRVVVRVWTAEASYSREAMQQTKGTHAGGRESIRGARTASYTLLVVSLLLSVLRSANAAACIIILRLLNMQRKEKHE